MKDNILVAPAHYIFSDKIPSEPAWSFTLVKEISKKVKSMDVLAAVKDLNNPIPGHVKIVTEFKTRSTVPWVEFLRHLIFYPWVTIKSLQLMRKKEYAVVHHMLPLSFATVNPLIFVVKLFFPNTKTILGPLQSPQLKGDEQDINLVLIGKTHYSFMSKIIFKATKFLTQIAKPFSSLMFSTADLVVNNSLIGQDYYKKLYPKAKFAYIPTGIDIPKNAKPNSKQNTKLIKIICAGQFSMRKGQIYLLQAMQKIIKENPNVRLTLIGDGDQDATYRDFVKNNKLDKYVTFTGRVSYADLLKAYQEHNIFCLPTLSDTSPYVILEAMMYGLPIVATEIGAIPEMVDKAGMIVPPANSSALAKAILALAKSSKNRIDMGKYGSQRVEKNYTWKIITDKWLEAYRSLGA